MNLHFANGDLIIYAEADLTSASDIDILSGSGQIYFHSPLDINATGSMALSDPVTIYRGGEFLLTVLQDFEGSSSIEVKNTPAPTVSPTGLPSVIPSLAPTFAPTSAPTVNVRRELLQGRRKLVHC